MRRIAAAVLLWAASATSQERLACEISQRAQILAAHAQTAPAAVTVSNGVLLLPNDDSIAPHNCPSISPGKR